jgi:SAM-dependent methyltransferase
MNLRADGSQTLSRRIDASLKRNGIRGFLKVCIRKAWLFSACQGLGRQCAFCHVSLRRFIPYQAKPSPLFTQEHIIGGDSFDQSYCPFCKSTARERHVYLFLQTCTSVFRKPHRLLHLAPEVNLRRILQRCENIRYVSADLAPYAHLRTDITALCFGDESFDVVICNHVLEHIPDDRRAMSEIIRVLKPGGWAILQVPIAASRIATVDGPSVSSPSERLRLFGQDNHVRLYGRDYARRLEAAGFSVELHSLPKENGDSYARRFGLLPDEDIYLAKKLTQHSLPSEKHRDYATKEYSRI